MDHEPTVSSVVFKASCTASPARGIGTNERMQKTFDGQTVDSGTPFVYVATKQQFYQTDGRIFGGFGSTPSLTPLLVNRDII
jgi:hypothetical protein